MAAPVLAHSFNMVLIAPENEAVRSDMQTAFLIASAERDSHAAQESDGHLGGLDVYLGIAAIGEADAIAGLAPDILAAPLAVTDLPAAAALARDLDAALIGPTDPGAALSQAMLGAALDPVLPDFARAFSSQTGRPPGPEAIAAYLAARRADAAVRSLGSADDTDRLRTLLAD